MLNKNNELLQISNLSFSYGKNEILREINFSIWNNEIVGLVGPNGSGKTTLIKNIIHELVSEHGEIKISSISNTLPKVQKEIMYLSSEDILPEFLSGREYILLLSSMYERPINQLLLGKLLDYYEIKEIFDTTIESYSHGMKKKMQLIGALLNQPRLLIVDETLNGIDIKAREVTKILFNKLVDKGHSILICTHDFSLVEELEARAIFIHNGRICYDSKHYLTENQTLRELFYDMIKTEEDTYELD